MADAIWFVVPAAGASRRMGAGVPKQYLPLAGSTVIEHALGALLGHPRVAGGVVVLAPGDTTWPELPEPLRRRVMTAVGGDERCHSVLAGVDALHAAGGDWVLVHDAARPCVSAGEIDALIAACVEDPVGGLLALPVADTLKRQDGESRVAATVRREALWRAQTPQMFRHALLARALREAIDAGEAPGDEAAAVERLGLRPRLVEGSALNIKITRPADLEFAAAVLAARAGGGS